MTRQRLGQVAVLDVRHEERSSLLPDLFRTLGSNGSENRGGERYRSIVGSSQDDRANYLQEEVDSEVDSNLRKFQDESCHYYQE